MNVEADLQVGLAESAWRGRRMRSASHMLSRHMPMLFSYGTLQEADVQRSAFGRLLEGEKDTLPAFEPSLVRIDDDRVVARLGRTHHANVIASRTNENCVSGTVFEVTDAELAAADRFEERFDYGRIEVTLASGIQAWVYVYRGKPT